MFWEGINALLLLLVGVVAPNIDDKGAQDLWIDWTCRVSKQEDGVGGRDRDWYRQHIGMEDVRSDTQDYQRYLF